MMDLFCMQFEALNIEKLMDAQDDESALKMLNFSRGSNPFLDKERCLLCNCERPDPPEADDIKFDCSKIHLLDDSEDKQSLENNPLSKLPLWVCSSCRKAADQEMEKKPTLEQFLDQESDSFLPDVSIKSGSEPTTPNGSICTCEACTERRMIESEHEQETAELQLCWMDLRKVVRCLYGNREENITEELNVNRIPADDHVIELVHKLCSRDPHQLFLRLESQVREFVIRMKVKLLKQLSTGFKTPPQAKEFISLLLEEYAHLSKVARKMTGLLKELQNHLKRFKVTWDLHNEHLFQSICFSEPSIKNCLNLLISQLRLGAASKEAFTEDTYPNLLHRYLKFEDEMSVINVVWRDCHQLIESYNEEQSAFKLKQNMLREDWNFKTQRKLFDEHFPKSLASLSRKLDAKLTTRRLMRRGNKPSQDKLTCPRCNRKRCPCDECTITHMITCGSTTGSVLINEHPLKQTETKPEEPPAPFKCDILPLQGNPVPIPLPPTSISPPCEDLLEKKGLDELIKYINGIEEDDKKPLSAKAAKRARQKQRKAEEKAKQEAEKIREELERERLRLAEERRIAEEAERKKNRSLTKKQRKQAARRAKSSSNSPTPVACDSLPGEERFNMELLETSVELKRELAVEVQQKGQSIFRYRYMVMEIGTIVLKKLCDIQRSINLSMKADITRLRNCRKEMMHGHTFLPEAELDSRIEDVTLILLRLSNGNDDLTRKIIRAQHLPLDEVVPDNHTIRGNISNQPLEPEIPAESLLRLTSLSLYGIKMEHDSLKKMVKNLSRNVRIENINLSYVSCNHHQDSDTDCTLTLNLQKIIKLTSLCLYGVNVVCDSVNCFRLQSIKLYPISKGIVDSYIEVFNCIKDSPHLERLEIYGSLAMLEDNTVESLTSAVKTLPKIKSLKLSGINLPDDVSLQLHCDVKHVKIVLEHVKMSKKCVQSFISNCVQAISEAHVEVYCCTITPVGEINSCSEDHEKSVNGATGISHLKSWQNTVRYICEYVATIPGVQVTRQDDCCLHSERLICTICMDPLSGVKTVSVHFCIH